MTFSAKLLFISWVLPSRDTTVSQSILTYRFACTYTHTALWTWYYLGFLWHHPESVLVKEPDFHVYPSMLSFSEALRYSTRLFCWVRTHNPTSYCSNTGAELRWNPTVFSFRALLIQEKCSLLSLNHSKSVIQLSLLKYITFLCIVMLQSSSEFLCHFGR